MNLPTKKVCFNIPPTCKIEQKKIEIAKGTYSDNNIILKEKCIKSYRNIKKFYYYISRKFDNWSYYIFCI